MKLTQRYLGATLGSLLALAVGVGSAVPAIAQSTTQALSSESVIETIKKRGVIKIGLSLFVPWSMRDLNGDLVGYEPDVGRQLAKDMGVEVEFIPTSWDGIIPALVSGSFDVIISGMSITPNRNLTVNFTEPYAFTGLAVYANKKITDGFSREDFNDPNVTFAARRGTTPAAAIVKQFPKAEVLYFDEDGAAAQEVLNGNAHATMAAQPTPNREVENYPETLYIPFETLFDLRGEGFALRKGDADALNFFNNWIGDNWRSGWLKERHNYWFAGTEWNSLVAE
ncbi:transporter substrate-binding domain-containing protein [Paracoccaceae bacterium]|nr:transporter substrate-binding domain-containing protein [Paracoccaceae bacterium]